MRFRPLVIASMIILAGCVQFPPPQLSFDYIKGSPYERALLLYQSGDLFEARRMTDEIKKDDPNYRAALKLRTDINSVMQQISVRHVDLGEEYERAGIFRTALEEYEEALKYNPSNQSARSRAENVASILKENKKPSPSAAKKPEKNEEKDDPAFIANMHYNKGKLYLSTGSYAKAIEEFNTALTYIPGYLDAKNLLEKAKAERDSAAASHFKKGISYFEAEQMEFAIREWDIVLELDPENKEAADYKSRAEVILKRLKKIREKQSAGPRYPLT